MFAPTVWAQHTSPDGTQRVWILIRSDTGAEITPSARAVARRALRASVHAPRHPDRQVDAAAIDALRAIGIEPIVQSRWLQGVSAEVTPDQLAAVRGLAVVADVRPVARLETNAMPSTLPLVDLDGSVVRVGFGQAAAQLTTVRANETLTAGLNGAGVMLGYLDTLYDFAHPTMAHLSAAGRLVGVHNFTVGSQSSYHGLATTSIGASFLNDVLVGPGNGASLIAATTEYAPTETHAEEDYFVAGLEWMEAAGVDVVNVSLSYSTFDTGGDYTPADMNGNTTLVTRASDIAAGLGVVMVVSAGNNGQDVWNTVGAPADADSVIVVGAVRSTGLRASFSAYGPTADGRMKPDVAALGVGVFTADPSGGVSSGSGTSYSAPMVAGIATQLLQANPSLTPIALRQILRETASQAAAPDNSLGWGIVDAVAAVQRASAVDPGPPTKTSLRVFPTVGSASQVRIVELQLLESMPVDLEIYDLLGRRVAVYSYGAVSPGLTQRSVSLPRLAPGAYVIRSTTGESARLVVRR